METNSHHTLTLGKLVGRRVREVREQRGLTQRALSARLEELGHPIHHTMLGRIERGPGFGQLDHLAALAAALEVAPAHLLAPRDDETKLAVVPELEPISAADARRWARGAAPLPGGDPVAFFAALPQDEQRALMRAYLTRGASPLTELLMDQEKLDERADDLAWEFTEGDAQRKEEGNA